MGDVKRRRKYNRELLAQHPWCVYCGGTIPAEDVDHVPSKMMFRKKQRPKGLEVPSCRACNNGSSKFEVIANAFGRIGLGESPEIDQTEFFQLLSDAEANNPGFHQEIKGTKLSPSGADRLGVPRGSAVYSTDGPIVSAAMARFAAKLGFALHSAETCGRIVPAGGAVLARWYANTNRLEGTFPDGIFDILGPKNSLTQGKWTVEERFSYSFAISDTERMAAYFAAFQFSFATLAFVVDEFEDRHKGPGFHVFRPGFIRENHPLETHPDDLIDISR
jgi:hypothetical protein